MRPYRFLLESVEGGAVRGRYSMIGMKPDLIWRVTGDKAEINTRALIDADGPFVTEDAAPLQSLRNLLAANHFDVPDDLPPMAAGLFGYMGYDMVRQMEQLPEPNEDVLGVPDGIMIRPTIMAIFDAVKDEVTIVTPVFPDADVSARAAYARACDRLGAVVDAFDRPLELQAYDDPDAAPINAPTSNTSPDDYMAMVLKAKEYVSAGDIFQVVLSQRFETDFALPAFSLYRACAGSIRHRSCTTWNSTGLPSPVPARKSSSGCVTARWKSARLPAPGRAVQRLPKIARWPQNCWPTPRNWPNT